MKNLIYGLVDPLTEEIRYIGKSTSGLSRPKDHLKPHKFNNETNHKAHWIKKLASKGLKPHIIVIEWVKDKSILNKKEIAYIHEFRKLGYNLTNLTEGGEGSIGRTLSEETKRKIGEKQKLHNENLDTPKIAHNRHHHTDNKKYCGHCNQLKNLSEYGKSKIHWDNLTQWCKECRKVYMQKYRTKYPPQKLSAKQWKESYKNRNKK